MPYAVACHRCVPVKELALAGPQDLCEDLEVCCGLELRGPCFDISLPPACWISLGMSLSHSELWYPCLFNGWQDRSSPGLAFKKFVYHENLWHFFPFVITLYKK